MLGVGESQDNPGIASVTPMFWDTRPQGCWGVGESQDNPGTTSVTQVFWDTSNLGWVSLSKIIPGLLELLCHARDIWYSTYMPPLDMCGSLHFISLVVNGVLTHMWQELSVEFSNPDIAFKLL